MKPGTVFAYELHEDLDTAKLGGRYVLGLVVYSARHSKTWGERIELLGVSSSLEFDDLQTWVVQRRNNLLIPPLSVQGLGFTIFGMAHHVGTVDIPEKDVVKPELEKGLTIYPETEVDLQLAKVFFPQLGLPVPEQHREHFVRAGEDEDYFYRLYPREISRLNTGDDAWVKFEILPVQTYSYWKLRELGLTAEAGFIWQKVIHHVWSQHFDSQLRFESTPEVCQVLVENRIDEESGENLADVFPYVMLTVFHNGDVLGEVLEVLGLSESTQVSSSSDTIMFPSLSSRGGVIGGDVLISAVRDIAPEIFDDRYGDERFRFDVASSAQKKAIKQRALDYLANNPGQNFYWNVLHWMCRTYPQDADISLLIDEIEKHQYTHNPSPYAFFTQAFTWYISNSVTPHNFGQLNRFLKLPSPQLRFWQAHAVHVAAKKKAFREDARFSWLKDSKFVYDPICAKDIEKLA